RGGPAAARRVTNATSAGAATISTGGSDGMGATELAAELARLEGIEEQFDALVKQIIAAQRQSSLDRIVGRAGATASGVARDVTVLDGALEKIEHNLRSQYEQFFSAHVALRVRRLAPDEMARYIELLRDERMQSYLARMRSLQE